MGGCGRSVRVSSILTPLFNLLCENDFFEFISPYGRAEVIFSSCSNLDVGASEKSHCIIV